MTTAVLLVFWDGRKEFIDEVHVHGYLDGQLLIATGPPGSGLDAEVVRTVDVVELTYAETCERDDSAEVDPDGGSGWLLAGPDG